jgi:hypothetical protein
MTKQGRAKDKGTGGGPASEQGRHIFGLGEKPYPYNVIFALTSFLKFPMLPQEFLALPEFPW